MARGESKRQAVPFSGWTPPAVSRQPSVGELIASLFQSVPEVPAPVVRAPAPVPQAPLASLFEAALTGQPRSVLPSAAPFVGNAPPRGFPAAPRTVPSPQPFGGNAPPRGFAPTPQARPAAARAPVGGGGPASRMQAAFRNMGYSEPVIAGILANAQHESSFDPTRSGDNGSAHGFFQHRNERVENFQRVIGVHPSRATPEQAAKFVDWELRNPKAAGMTPEQAARIRNAKSPAEAAMMFQQFYERPAKIDPARAHTAAGMLGQVADEMGVVNPFGAPGSAFDPSLYKPMLGALDAAGAAAMQPSSTTFTPTPMPEMPEAPDLPSRDFTATDAIIKEMAPKPFTEAEKSATRRRMLWQGAAQALGGLSEDAHVGSILAKVGAGMLAGRLGADDEIQRRADLYDQKMQEYNKLRLGNESGKAEAKFQEATQEVQMAFARGVNMWQAKHADWLKNGNSIEKVGNSWVVTRNNPDGSRTVENRPIGSEILPAIAMAKAQAFGNIADGQNNATVMDTRLLQSGILGVTAGAAAASAFEPEIDDVTAALEGAQVMGQVAADSGYWRKIMGEEGSATLTAAAKAALGIRPGEPVTKDQQEEINKYIAVDMAEIFASPDGQDILKKHASQLGAWERVKNRRKVREKQGNRTVTYEE